MNEALDRIDSASAPKTMGRRDFIRVTTFAAVSVLLAGCGEVSSNILPATNKLTEKEQRLLKNRTEAVSGIEITSADIYAIRIRRFLTENYMYTGNQPELENLVNHLIEDDVEEGITVFRHRAFVLENNASIASTRLDILADNSNTGRDLVKLRLPFESKRTPLSDRDIAVNFLKAQYLSLMINVSQARGTDERAKVMQDLRDQFPKFSDKGATFMESLAERIKFSNDHVVQQLYTMAADLAVSYVLFTCKFGIDLQGLPEIRDRNDIARDLERLDEIMKSFKISKSDPAYLELTSFNSQLRMYLEAIKAYDVTNVVVPPTPTINLLDRNH